MHSSSTSSLYFDSSNMPTQFIWPNTDLLENQKLGHQLNEPLVDLKGYLNGDQWETTCAAELIKRACTSHGVFQVTNHGIDGGLIRAAYDEVDAFFNLPIEDKLRFQRINGSVCGYSNAHSERYSSMLPWKETFSFGYRNGSDSIVEDYFKTLGNGFAHTGSVYQKYCEAMNELSLVIMELLAISLGIDRLYYRRFFEDGSSIMRWNYYPPCKDPMLTLGTGPHCDPTSLTILHQDQVGGLEVFADDKWQVIVPRPDSLVVNLGDTFMALTNGRYKSCIHRAVVNREKERKSLVYFVSPKEDKIVCPQQDLVMMKDHHIRKYPDFTWSDLLEFTQVHYRADVTTLQSFVQWFLSSKTI